MRSPLSRARAVARALAADGLHGQFTVGRIEQYRGSWDIYRAEIDTTLDLGDSTTLIAPFDHYLSKEYKGRGIIMLRVIMVDAEGDAIDDDQWRSLTSTGNARAVFGQVPYALEHWTYSVNYRTGLLVSGVEVQLER